MAAVVHLPASGSPLELPGVTCAYGQGSGLRTCERYAVWRFTHLQGSSRYPPVAPQASGLAFFVMASLAGLSVVAGYLGLLWVRFICVERGNTKASQENSPTQATLLFTGHLLAAPPVVIPAGRGGWGRVLRGSGRRQQRPAARGGRRCATAASLHPQVSLRVDRGGGDKSVSACRRLLLRVPVCCVDDVASPSFRTCWAAASTPPPWQWTTDQMEDGKAMVHPTYLPPPFYRHNLNR